MYHSLYLQRRLIALFLAVSLVASLTTVALAANIDINTTDGLIDPDWPAAPFVSDPTGDVADPNVDIFAARVGVNHLDYPSPAEIAFRIDLLGQFPNSDGYFIMALLDCNRDGAMTGAGDVTIYLDPVDDFIFIKDGGLHEDSLASPTVNAEVVHYGGSAYTYEWKVPMGGGTVNWNWCTPGNIDITFNTYDGFNSIVMDTTTTRGFDVPTVVEVTGVKVSSSRSVIPSLALAATVLLFGLFGLVRFRALKNR